MSSTSLWWLVVLWGGVAGVIGAAVGMWVLTRRLRELAPVESNVLRLPPCADRSGPTHVVTVPRVFDFDREPA